MPGVKVTTTTRTGPTTPAAPRSGQWFVVGLAERGDTTKPILLRGMADYEGYLGSRVTYGSLYDAVKLFFDEGGQQCYVARVVGAAATKGTLTLVDRATPTPVNTLRVDAKSAGDWSTQLKVEVRDGLTANTVRVIVTLNDHVVEDYDNLANPAAIVAAFSASNYVTVTDLGSVTVAPNNNPAVIAATALSAGADDRAAVDAAAMVAALARFTPDYGTGAVSIPGYGLAVHAGINTHCAANNRIGIMAASLNDPKATLITDAAAINSPYVGIVAPWVTVSDGAGGSRTISPEGYAAACRARGHQLTGSWRIPAGEIALSRSILNVTQEFSAADADDLDNAGVSIIRVVQNSVRLYGWRSLSIDKDNYEFLSVQDLLNTLVIAAQNTLEQFVFQPVDAKGQLLSAINAALVGMCDPIARAGGLYAKYDTTGRLIDPGYKVDTSPNVNTPSTLATNTVKAVLTVRPAPNAAEIALQIIKAGFNSGL